MTSDGTLNLLGTTVDAATHDVTTAATLLRLCLDDALNGSNESVAEVRHLVDSIYRDVMKCTAAVAVYAAVEPEHAWPAFVLRDLQRVRESCAQSTVDAVYDHPRRADLASALTAAILDMPLWAGERPVAEGE